MSSTLPTSELDAVNTMLSLIGEAPVNSLSVTGLGDVAIAKSILNEVSRETQEKGWAFNTESNYLLTRNIDNEIVLPANTMRVTLAPRHASLNVIERAGKLYDRKNHTFTFTEDLYVEITFLLPYTELPQAARHFVMIKAARKFQRRVLGSDGIERWSAEEEMEAYARIEDADCDVGKYNMLTGNYDAYSIIARNYI